MSSHGLQWYGGCINGSSIEYLKTKWGADVIRLAMYVEEGGYKNDPEGWKVTLREKIDAVIEAGLYVIIDWHILADGNPQTNQAEAEEFFGYFSALYANVPNVIYEICNEPNGNGPDSWSAAIKPYAEDIIPIIRSNSPEAIVLVGTPAWSSRVGDVLTDPLTEDNARNTLYSFHFYAGSHFTQEYISRYAGLLPIFANEWGTSSYSGNDLFNAENAQSWLELFAGNNEGSQLISWCNWSFSDKYETSAALTGGSCYNGDWENVSESGALVKTEMSTEDNFITGFVTSPKIVAHPFNVSTTEGTQAQFRVKAIGPDLEYTWLKDGIVIENENESKLIINNISADDLAEYSVTITNEYGTVTSNGAMLSFDSQAPADSVIAEFPGKLEFEKFDQGGEGIAFHDLGDLPKTGSSGDSVPVGFLTDIGDNEWVEYTVDVKSEGYFTFKYMLSNGEDFPKFYISIDKQKVTEILLVPTTESWEVITDSATVHLSQGKHILKIYFVNGKRYANFDLDYLQASIVDCNGDENGTAEIDHCGICSGGNTGIEPSVDTDNDGMYDCEDGCPNDPLKTEGGICGCGVEEGQCDDCNGEFGGTAFIDHCGVCAGGTTGIVPDESCIDCNGDINGTAGIDSCGVCSGGNTGIAANTTCKDCDGVLFGEAVIDGCGVCAGGNTGNIPDQSCIDCEGVLFGNAVLDDCGVCGGDNSSCEGTLTPYKGIKLQIPGKIEAEYFDAGGSGVAYSDADEANSGNTFRVNEEVDIATEGTKYCIGWIAGGEWVKYTVDVTHSGEYSLLVYGGTPGDNNTFDLEIGDISQTINFPNTGSYSDFDTVIVSGFRLTEGEYVMTVTFNNDGCNLDFLEFVAVLTDCNGDPDGTAYLDQCGICVGGNTGIAPSDDTDEDGVFDCVDGCPNDPLKTAPGNCGCGVAEGECKDCNGELGGLAFIDNCDICAGGSTGITPNESCSDCNGDVNGTASIDDCGVCSGGKTGIAPNASCTDCNGDLNGSAEIDECGVCAGGNTGIVPDATCIDCKGVPFGDAVVDECGICGGDNSTCQGSLAPFRGEMLVIPGKIEAEYYDAGGAGIAYNDSDEINSGTEFRLNEAVDVITEGKKQCVGWIYSGEWLKYTVDVDHTGEYALIVYSATPADDNSMLFEIGSFSKTVTFPNSGSYADFDSVVIEGIMLEEGIQVMTLTFNNDGTNLDYINFRAINRDCNGDMDGTAQIDACGLCTGGNTGIEPAIDSDSDGVYDCNDNCPNDPLKTEPGSCGCGVAEGQCDDCNGDFGGTAFIDNCGICAGGNTGIVPDESCTDCNGDLNGTAEIDNCGVCAGGTTGNVPNTSCTDCNGIPFGTAEIDNCGICAGGNTGIIPDKSCTDCMGVLNGDAVLDDCGVCNGDNTSCQGILTPYQGDKLVIPGKIEAEFFDAGGSELAYLDSDSTYSGDGFRSTEFVDVVNEGTGYSIGWVHVDEWLKYTVDVKYSGAYSLIVYNATPAESNKMKLEIGSLTDTIIFANSGSYSDFDSVVIEGVNLEAGEQIMTITFLNDGTNLDFLFFRPEFSIDCNGDKDGSAYYDECYECVGGETGISPCAIQTIAFAKGWNLFSINIDVDDKNLESVFGPHFSVVETVKDLNNQYRKIQTSAYNQIDIIEPNKGYLLEAALPFELYLKGKAILTPPQPKPLKEGWNLIAYPASETVAIETALSSIWDYVEEVWSFEGHFIKGGDNNTLKELTNGSAYYIKLTSACSLEW